MCLGSNSTFVYSVLFEAIESWLSSFLAATFALPDPALFDILDSPTPGTSLAAALTATAITALVLAPIDLYRITYLSRYILLSNHIIVKYSSQSLLHASRQPEPNQSQH